ncbi:MAG: S-adenosyl-methyltransferase [Bacteroidia bacterium]|nr:S-adenosyl-methyltransferase [Bacteroidia bacterium]
MSENIGNKEITQNINQQILGREQFASYLPFILFITFIFLLYIYFSHRTDRKIRKIDKLNKEVKELYSENITLQTEILNKTRSSYLEPLLLNYGIKPSTTQPKIIK